MNKLIYGNHHQIVTFHNLKINYWSIPKCGSTTIKYALHKADTDPIIFKQQEKNFSTNDDIHSWVHAINICEKINPHDALTNGYINFMVVRNPKERFISLYNDFFIKRKNNNIGGTLLFKNAINKLRNNPSHLELLKILQQFPDEHKDTHFRSQSWFYLDNTIKLISLENINTIQKFNKNIYITNIHLHKTKQIQLLNTKNYSFLQKIYENDFKLYISSNQ